MTAWAPSTLYPGYLVKTTEHKNCIVNVHRPVLTDEEYQKRLDAVKKATAEVLIAIAKKEAEERRGRH